MRPFIVLYTLAILVAGNLQAQTRGKLKRGWVNTFVVAGVDYHLNASDVDSQAILTSKNTVGQRFGVSFVRMGGSRIIVSPTLLLRLTNQKLEIDYPLENTGYNTTEHYKQRISFKNIDLLLKFNGGYSLLLSEKSALEICAGLAFDFPLSGAYQEDVVLQDGLDPQYGELILYRQSSWGNKKSAGNTDALIRANALFDFNVDYRFWNSTLLGNRSFKIGLNICNLVRGNYNNRTILSRYGRDRTKLGSETFNDRQLSLGLTFAFEL